MHLWLLNSQDPFPGSLNFWRLKKYSVEVFLQDCPVLLIFPYAAYRERPLSQKPRVLHESSKAILLLLLWHFSSLTTEIHMDLLAGGGNLSASWESKWFIAISSLCTSPCMAFSHLFTVILSTENVVKHSFLIVSVTYGNLDFSLAEWKQFRDSLWKLTGIVFQLLYYCRKCIHNLSQDQYCVN